MSTSKEFTDSFPHGRNIKRTSDKRNRSVLAPSSTVLNNNLREDIVYHQFEEQLHPNRSVAHAQDELHEVIYSSEKEIDFLNKILSQFLDINELMKIKQNSQYDEITRSWVIPNFIVQQRKTVFPKLHRSQMREVIQNELKQKKVIMKLTPTPDFAYPLYPDDEMIRNKQQVPNSGCEFDNRPGTSLAKQRKKSNGIRAPESEMEYRKSTPIKKKNMEKKPICNFYE